jgi:hypothetical protein
MFQIIARNLQKECLLVVRRIWRWLFHKRVMSTKFDIYVLPEVVVFQKRVVSTKFDIYVLTEVVVFQKRVTSTKFDIYVVDIKFSAHDAFLENNYFR